MINTAPTSKQTHTHTANKHAQYYILLYGGIVYTPKLSLTIKRCLLPRPRARKYGPFSLFLQHPSVRFFTTRLYKGLGHREELQELPTHITRKTHVVRDTLII